ncbi:hypothetical protein N7501_011586 [Penicillium viridicatum]|nr:hypothetical protein N7501_011586 [Penicillium viridicatum]
MPQAIILKENFLSKWGPTWETFFDRGVFCTLQIKRPISNKSKLLYNGHRRHTLSLCEKKKKEKGLRNRIHLPRGLLILLHIFLVTLQIHQPPARRRVTLQKRCIPRNVAWKRETPELIPSMALKLSFLLLNSREA